MRLKLITVCLVLLTSAVSADEALRFGGVAPGESWKAVRQRLGPPKCQGSSKDLKTYEYADGTGMEVRDDKVFQIYGFPTVTREDKVVLRKGATREAAVTAFGEPWAESPEQPGSPGVAGPEGQVSFRLQSGGLPYTLVLHVEQKLITFMALYPVTER